VCARSALAAAISGGKSFSVTKPPFSVTRGLGPSLLVPQQHFNDFRFRAPYSVTERFFFCFRAQHFFAAKKAGFARDIVNFSFSVTIVCCRLAVGFRQKKKSEAQ